MSPQRRAVYFAGTIPLFIGNWSDAFCAFLWWLKCHLTEIGILFFTTLFTFLQLFVYNFDFPFIKKTIMWPREKINLFVAVNRGLILESIISDQFFFYIKVVWRMYLYFSSTFPHFEQLYNFLVELAPLINIEKRILHVDTYYSVSKIKSVKSKALYLGNKELLTNSW